MIEDDQPEIVPAVIIGDMTAYIDEFIHDAMASDQNKGAVTNANTNDSQLSLNLPN